MTWPSKEMERGTMIFASARWKCLANFHSNVKVGLSKPAMQSHRALLRPFTSSAIQRVESRTLHSSGQQPQRTAGEEEAGNTLENAITQSKEKQIRTPWHRQGSSLPPVARPRRAGAMVKGRTFPPPLLKKLWLTGKVNSSQPPPGF